MPFLDEQQLAELIELMGDDLGNLVNAYLRDSSDRLLHLDRAFAAGDWEGVRRQAHSLKGSSSNLGAQQLASQCQLVEALAAHIGADASELATALIGLRATLSAVQQELRQRFA